MVDMASKGEKGGGGNARPKKYAEMIMEAIKALNDENGCRSSKTGISDHIEDTYGELPPIHNALLTHHLKRMVASGQLYFARNRYHILDPDAPPPRRRRGRQRNPKEPVPPGEARPRGKSPEGEKEGGETVAPGKKRKKKRATPPDPAGAEPLAAETASGEERGGGGLVEVKIEPEECVLLD